MVDESFCTSRETASKHGFRGPEKVRNDAKERRKEKKKKRERKKRETREKKRLHDLLFFFALSKKHE